MLYIGIDPGTNTGLAIWDGTERRFLAVRTTTISSAMKIVEKCATAARVSVVFEDARQRKYLPRERTLSEYRGKLMGAGAVKRDCAIWEDFCKEEGITYTAVPPRKGATKWTQESFAAVTGWKGRTSNHARDAALLVFGK